MVEEKRKSFYSSSKGSKMSSFMANVVRGELDHSYAGDSVYPLRSLGVGINMYHYYLWLLICMFTILSILSYFALEVYS